MLNHVYCLVWSDAAASYVPVSEKSDGRAKSISGSTPAVKSSNNLPSHIKSLNLCKFSAIALALSIICHTAKADTLPTGGSIVAGAGSISQTNTNMTITQSTAKMAANWQTFNIGADNAVKFVQPSSSSVALNQVLGSDVSVIQGNLSANGQVFLVNPNGVLFTPTSQINAGGLVASTLRLSTDDFMDGNFTFVGESSNAIINRGNITVNNAGSIALIAAKITNTGTLTAHTGSVLLGAGANVTLDLGGPVEIQVTQAAIDASIENKGGIKADGGLVYLTAQATQALVTSVISNTGIIEAHTLATGENGQIMLMGGMDDNRIMVAGILDASAPNGGNGGFIETSAAHVRIADDAKVTTFAATGDSGNWLIDPADFNIGDASTDAPANITGIALSNNLVNTNVEIMSFNGTDGGSGNINVNEEVSWSANTLTLTAAKDININSVMTASGTSTLVLNTATSNGGDVAVAGGQVFVGMHANGFTGRVDFAETDGTNARSGTGILTINGAEYNILNTVDQLANMTITGNFALGGNLGTAGSTFDFTPIASFANNFNGLGHTITGMNIDGIAAANTGMIRIAGAGSDVRNVGLVGGKIINGGAGTGGLIGSGTTGNVSNSYNTGTVTGVASTGGLVGSLTTGNIVNSFATGAVIGAAGTGGLVGSLTSGNIVNSFTTGAVIGAAGTGGLVGSLTTGSVSNGFATGDVIGAASTGGLIGNITTGPVSNSYATGSVDGDAGTGGLIGTKTSGDVTESYATGNVDGAAGTGGLIGSVTTAVIKDVYATGNVAGAAGVGGLLGNSTAAVTNAYAAGTVSGAAPGGLFGTTTGVLTDNFWNKANATHSVGVVNSTPAGTTGLTSDQMMKQATFPNGWDFTNIWFIDEGSSFPLLRTFMTALTVTANSFTKTYDGNKFSGNGVTYSFAGATPSGTLSYTGSAQNSVNAGSYTIIPKGLISSQQGYMITYVDGTLTTNQALLTLFASKVYDGTTTLTDKVTIGGLVGTETLNYTDSNVNDKNVTTANKFISNITLTDGTGLVSNYMLPALNAANAAVTITPKALTVSGIAANNKVYDGNVAATMNVDGKTLTGLIAGDDVTVSASGAFSNKNAGNAKTVSLTSTSAGTDAGNYLITGQASTTADITRANLSVGGITASGKVYDGNVDAALDVSGKTLTGLIAGDDVTVSASGAFSDKNAGDAKTVSLTSTSAGTDAGNYLITGQASTTADITRANLSVGGITASGKVYDGNVDAALDVSGKTLTGLIAGDTVTVSASGAFSDKNAGDAKTVSLTSTSAGTDAGNYLITGQASTTADITRANLSVGGITASGKVYDGNVDAALDVSGKTLTGLIAGDTVTVSASGAFSDKNAGDAKTVSLTSTSAGTDAGNYLITGQASTTADITRANLSVGGITASGKVYDGNVDAALDVSGKTLTGLIAGDTVTMSASGAFSDKNAGDAKTVSLTSTSTGTDAGNYLITGQASTTADITRANLSVGGITASGKVYDGNVDAALDVSGKTLTGLIAGDTVTVSASGAFSDKNAGDAKTVSLTSTSAGTDAGNYLITGQASTTADITPKELTVSGMIANDKVFDGNENAVITGGLLNGFVNDETLSFSGQTGQFVNANVGNDIEVTVNGMTLIDGTGIASNYTVSKPGNLSANITNAAEPIDNTDASELINNLDNNPATPSTNTVVSGVISNVVANVRVPLTISSNGPTTNANSSTTGGIVDVQEVEIGSDSEGDRTSNPGEILVVEGGIRLLPEAQIIANLSGNQ